MSNNGYEFSENENVSLAKLASFLKVFAYGLIVGGALQAVASGLLTVQGMATPEDHPHLWATGAMTVAGVVGLILGNVLLNAANYFMLMVDTEGHDIAHLMQALARLTRFFSTSAAVLWVYIVVLFATLGLSVLGQLEHSAFLFR